MSPYLPEKIQKIVANVVEITEYGVDVIDKYALREGVIDSLVIEATFGDPEDMKYSRWLIWEIAQGLDVKPSSIHNLYIARGHEEIPLNFSVPAMNLKGMTYDMARAIFRVARDLGTGLFIIELARSEMQYTHQSPEAFTSAVLAAAIKEDWYGPVFIQGDHFQPQKEYYGIPKTGEIESIKKLITESINAGFYNIDIDASTLVDLSKTSIAEQQAPNIKHTLDLLKHIRSSEPENVTISIGGEIGHIGGKNSTVEDFRTFMNGLFSGLKQGVYGISKVSVQTGTEHGGKVLSDGSIASVDIDFSILYNISKIARTEYKVAGAVQHGASTLPDNYFAEFPNTGAIEIHLATGLQNLIMDHPDFPKDLLAKIYDWIDSKKATERKEDQTEEQFHYRMRKQAWGEFARDFWAINNDTKQKLMNSLEEKLSFLFQSLNVSSTRTLVSKHISTPTVHKIPADFGRVSVTQLWN